MRKIFTIHEEVVISYTYDFAPIPLNFLIYGENFIFFFISSWCKVKMVKVVPLAIGNYLEYLTQALPIVYEAGPVEQMDYPVHSIQKLFRIVCLNYEYINISIRYATMLSRVLRMPTLPHPPPCSQGTFPRPGSGPECSSL
jgi:hypothetical protein